MKNSDILFYAFRYALGRRTGVVLQMVDHISNVWDKIPSGDKFQIKREILHAIDIGQAGADIDIKEWRRILELDD